MLMEWNKSMKRVKLFLVISSLFSLVASIAFSECNPNKIVALVPGTLNSAVPGAPSSNPYDRAYYSQSIIETVSKYACNRYVIKGLSWFGDFQENGKVVFDELLEWQSQHQELQGLPIEIIAHSAGGFYSLQAVSFNFSKGSPLKFSKLHFLSTPMKGLELANILTANPFVRRQMEKIFNQNYKGLDVRGLWQLRTNEVEIFLGTLKIPNEIEVHTYAGVQKSPPSFEREFESAFLPPVFQAFEFLMDGLGDGVVSYESALGRPELHSSTGTQFTNLWPHPELEVPLDHVEEVWDYKYLEYLGFQKTQHVQQAQINFIEQVLNPEK